MKTAYLLSLLASQLMFLCSSIFCGQKMDKSCNTAMYKSELYASENYIDSELCLFTSIDQVSLSNTQSCNNNGTDADESDDYITTSVFVLFGTGIPTTGTLDLSGDVLNPLSVDVQSIQDQTFYFFENVQIPVDYCEKNINVKFSEESLPFFFTTPKFAPCSNNVTLVEQPCDILDGYSTKTLLVNFHVMQYSEAEPKNFSNTCEDLHYLSRLIYSANAETWDNAGLQEWCDGDPLGIETAMCDTKIHLELNLIQFHQDMDAWDNYGLPQKARYTPLANFIKDGNGQLKPEYENAINVFYVEGGCGNDLKPGGCGAGFALGLDDDSGLFVVMNGQYSSWQAQVQNDPDAYPDVEASSGLLNHEIGHYLTLDHIWLNNAATKNCPNCQSLDWEAGSNMMMGYTYNKRYITAEELNTIHDELETEPHYQIINDPSHCSDTHIYDNLTIPIDEAIRYCGDVYIENGATVTVKGSILMQHSTSENSGDLDYPDNAYSYIHVMPGGKLIVDGGLIMTDRGWKFGGVRIYGDGEIEMKGVNLGNDEWKRAKLHGAHTGIYKTESSSVALGTVKIDRALFSECKTGIFLNNTVQCADFNSSVLRAEFSGLDSDRGVRLRRSEGVVISMCEFKGQKKNGIWIKDSEMVFVWSNLFENIVKSPGLFASGVYMKNSRAHITNGNHFRLCSRGVDIDNDNCPFDGSTIAGGDGSYNIFDTSDEGIYVRTNVSNTPLNIWQNVFSGGIVGIKLENKSTFKISNNHFYNDWTGIWSISTNTGGFNRENFIVENRFNTDSPHTSVYGIKADGNNRKLQIKLNCFETSNTDIIISAPGIAGEQGSSTESAANCFTQNGVTAIDNNGWGLVYYEPISAVTTNCSRPEIVNNVTIAEGTWVDVASCTNAFNDPDPQDEFCDCDYIFLADKSSSIDDTEKEVIDCSITETMHELDSLCQDSCKTRFAFGSFSDTDDDMTIDDRFDCNKSEAETEDSNGKTNLASGLGGIIKWLNEDIELDEDSENDFNSECLKIILYTDSECQDFNDFYGMDGVRYSVLDLINILQSDFGAEVTIIHFENVDEDGLSTNNLDGCKYSELISADSTAIIESEVECESLLTALSDPEDEEVEERSRKTRHLDNGLEAIFEDKNKDVTAFTVYPNPFKEILNVEFEESGTYQIEITNSMSQHVYNKVVEANSNSISIESSGWPAGIYYIKCMNSIKQHDFSLKKVILVD